MSPDEASPEQKPAQQFVLDIRLQGVQIDRLGEKVKLLQEVLKKMEEVNK